MPADPKLTHVATQWQYESPLISCRFDPQARFLFTTAEDQLIQRWDVASGNKITFTAHDSWVRGLTFLNDGEILISGGFDGRIVWWPATAEKPEPIRSIEAHAGWVRDLAVSPDGKLLASAGNDDIVRLWNTTDGTLVRELTGHAGDVYSVVFHPSGAFVVSGDLKGDVRQWDVATGALAGQFDAKELWSFNGGQFVDYGGVRSLAFCSDGKRLACSGLYKAENPLGAVNDPLVLVFDWDTRAKLRTHIAEGVKGVAWRSVYHPDGTLIGCNGGSGGGYLLFWQADQDKEIFRLQMPNTTRDMDLHPDGMRIATIHHDRHVRISLMSAKS